MAKPIIWSSQAHHDRRQILQFWIDHNQSVNYSLKLNELFKKAIALISEYPQIGRPTDFENVRVKTVKEYQIFYQEFRDSISILTFWDTRQNPDELKNRLT